MKNDQFSLARGGWSRYLTVSCKNCGVFLFVYQKDGPGPLKRCYLDRIIDYQPNFDKKGYLFCHKCLACLGFSEPYAKEGNRPAIRLAAEAIAKNITSRHRLAQPRRS